MGYTITRELTRDFATALADTRAALADNGFGVLTEIDMKGLFGLGRAVWVRVVT
jgi:uncharacterized protein (DUF302 family)